MINFTRTAVAVAIGFTLSNGVMAQALSKDDYKAEMNRIAAAYKADKANCESFSGNANDICLASANRKEKTAKADLEVRDKNTIEARYEALVTTAEANYAVAKEKCDDQAGNPKDVCLKEAKAAETAAKADAKAQMKISGANSKVREESAEARKEVRDVSADARSDAAAEKRAASYSVAKEKCEPLAGGAKDNCMSEAKALYGKI